jgi:hypothetical protein
MPHSWLPDHGDRTRDRLSIYGLAKLESDSSAFESTADCAHHPLDSDTKDSSLRSE